MPGRSVTEAARGLETLKYESVLLGNTAYNDVANLLPSSSLRPSTDTSLTGLAQVAALRLNAARALISLFDRHHQHVIAESTPGLRICDGPPSERLWLCGTAIPRSSGLCEKVLQPPDLNASVRVVEPARLAVTVVNDLLAHGEFQDKWYCQAWPHNRFYAGVPIRSRRGINIGVLCVFDDKPRDGLSETSIQVLRDLSGAILSHLEVRHSGDDRRPGHRMLRGLGSYVEGRATMSDWDDQSRKPVSHNNENASEGFLNRAQQDIQRDRDENFPVSFAGLTEPLVRPPAPITKRSTDEIPTGLRSMSNDGEAEASGVSGAEDMPLPQIEDREGQLQQIFSRAANIVRESVEIEGVLFLDASARHPTGMANAGISQNVRFGRHRSISPSSTSSSSSTPELPSLSPLPKRTEESDAVCEVLGFSTSRSSSIDDGTPHQSHQVIPPSFLQRLLRRYPRGKIFNFDGHGTLIPSDASSSEEAAAVATEIQGPHGETSESQQQPRRKDKAIYYRKNESKAIAKLFPGVRSVCFVPLWDSQRQRWSAAGFVYTMTPTRVFTVQGELSYLSAFATVIMSDVALMESSLAATAASSLLGSLSHELRSPLHGIVLCTELLHDTSLNVFQGDMLRSLETCGRTLLDTINHLLDWTKINNFIKSPAANHSQRRSRGDRSNSMADGMMHLTSHLELDTLIEEVVECMHAGYTYQQLPTSRSIHEAMQEQGIGHPHARFDAMEDAPGDPNPRVQPFSDPTIIMLDVDPASEWIFEVQAGALRRIVMNICSNSLRHTDRGFVKIVAFQEPIDQSRSRDKVVHIDFVDTGSGMGPDYLNQMLFTPFSKEHAHSAGAGLGLSLVRKFIQALGGSIQVRSQLNKGTKVSVRLPLRAPTLTPNSLHGREEFDAQVTELSRLRVSLTGFPAAKKVILGSDTATEDFDEQALLSRVCRDWLQMDVVGFGSDRDFVPDLILCDESAISSLTHRTELSSPVIIVCRNPAAAREMERAHRAHHKLTWGLFSCISRPVGPRKLARALVLCFRRWTRLQAEAADRLSIATSLDEGLSSLDAHSDKASAWLDKTEGSSYFDAAGQPASPPEAAGHGVPAPIPLTASRDDSIGADASRFLLVEDNPINMKILQTYMRRLGQAYDSAGNGQQAVDMYRDCKGQYKCILMDISMPVMDGFEATRLIRGLERDGQLPRSHIIAITGLASREAQEEAFATGLDLFLSKPVKLKELGRILKERGLV